MRAFQAAARKQRRESPLVTPWREHVQQLEADRAELRSENAELRATLQTYAEFIDDLSRASSPTPCPIDQTSAVSTNCRRCEDRLPAVLR